MYKMKLSGWEEGICTSLGMWYQKDRKLRGESLNSAV